MIRRLIPITMAFAAALAASALLSGPATAGPLADSGAAYPRVGQPLKFGFADSSGVTPFQGSAAPQRLAELEAAAGAEIARLSVRWDRVEPKAPNLLGAHSYDWRDYQGQIEAFRAQGIGTIAVILDAPRWANDDSPSCQSPHATCPPDLAHVDDFAAFAVALQKRFGGRGLAGIEVWNEPNLELLWDTNTGPDPERYAQLFAAVRYAVRGVDPALPVIVGGLTVPPFNANTQNDIGLAVYLERFYGAVPDGALDSAVGVGFHAYPGYKLGGGSGNKIFKRTLRQTVAVTNRNDPGRALWATELGQSTTDTRSKEPPSQRRQAQTILRMIEKVDAEPRAVAVMIYTVVDRPRNTGGQSGFGVVGPGPKFEPKRAYCKLAQQQGMPKPGGC